MLLKHVYDTDNSCEFPFLYIFVPVQHVIQTLDRIILKLVMHMNIVRLK